jgi:hypothetical protein
MAESVVPNTSIPTSQENSTPLKCIPFYRVDYANYNKFLRNLDKTNEENLDQLLKSNYLKIVTFSVFNGAEDSQNIEETLDNFSFSIKDIKDIKYLDYLTTRKDKTIDEELKKELFTNKFLKIVKDNSSPNEKKLELTIKAKQKINIEHTAKETSVASGQNRGNDTKSIPFHDIGDIPDEGSMLFFTEEGKAQVNQEADNKGITTMPYSDVTASGAILKTVTIKTGVDIKGDPETSEKQVFASQEMKEKVVSTVEEYYKKLDDYESKEIDKFLQNPKGYIPAHNDIPVPDKKELDAYSAVEKKDNDDLIVRTFKRILGDDNVTIGNKNMVLAVVRVVRGKKIDRNNRYDKSEDNEEIVIELYYYTNYGHFYNIKSMVPNLSLGSSTENLLEGLKKYIDEHSEDTFLCIDFDTMNIKKCFYLSDAVRNFYVSLNEQVTTTLPREIADLQLRIKNLNTELDNTKKEFDNRHNTTSFVDRWVADRKKYTDYADGLRVKIKNYETEIKKYEKELQNKNKKLDDQTKKLNSNMEIIKYDPITLKKIEFNGAFNEKSLKFNFTLNNVIEYCNSGQISTGSSGGNSNKRHTKKLRKQHDIQKSRKRLIKKSRKRLIKKSRKRLIKKSRKRLIKKSRKH